mmetsp:Transcript_5252/g.5385  ORF Transcript_5252/g.5385 Transcript_5252/m.5385 type:complete len:96 (-) Transcript_5252:243-530(-)
MRILNLFPASLCSGAEFGERNKPFMKKMKATAILLMVISGLRIPPVLPKYGFFLAASMTQNSPRTSQYVLKKDLKVGFGLVLTLVGDIDCPDKYK